ncbi:MAG TPA: PQQ-dependent sugar dehydrogenase [Chloroflexota bacterium]|jgi:glucose/arabinose dehydrogenase|nr:PQQ-dependent sugar dehydrogenase [Chloroflexota bacterium]
MAYPLRTLAVAALLPALAASLLDVSYASATPRLAAGTRLSTIVLPNGSRETLQTPTDLQVSLYATGVTNARFMALGPHGDVFVGTRYNETVSVLLNRKAGIHATQVVTLLSGLSAPHSVVYRKGLLYVAEEGQVSSWSYNAAAVSVSNQHVIVSSLPAGGLHFTRTLAFAPDGSFYVSVGSSCNECVDYADRAVIMHYRSDGTGGQVYARGLRNAVGLAVQPGTGRLWAVDNGEDSLGDNAPPDELDLIKQGGNYGWPYCYDNGQPDPSVSSAAGYCAHTINPVVALPAHSAPLGLTFYTGKQLPARYRGGLFVAYHGSTYRSQATGYKVVYIPVQGTHAGTPQDVVTGWLPAGATSGGAAWGRPVGLLVAADGSLLISDDQAGVVYRLSLAGH